MTNVVTITLGEFNPTAGLPYDHVEPLPREQLDQLLAKTKGRLFFKKGAGFLGSLLCDHEFVWDDTCQTAWCNGSQIGWNPKFFTWLTPEERVTILAHELWHTGYLHMARIGVMRCPDYWNIAADHVINLRLQADGYTWGEKLQSLGAYMDPQYANMSTEQVYDLIAPKDGKPMPQPNGSPGPNQGDQGAGLPMDGDVRVPAEGLSQDKLIGKVVKAAQASRMSKEAGVIPGETELIIDEFLNPILPWEVLLQRYFTELSKDDYSWKRPSRRYEDEYLPSMDGDNGLEHIMYFLDISGSVADEDILRFNSEVKYIHDALAPKKLTLVTFDTKLQDFYEFADDEAFEKVVVTGRGGTDLAEVQELIKKQRPTAAVIFSDLYCDPMTENPGSPILWVVVDHKKAQVPFGEMIHIQSEYTGLRVPGPG
jgi:predicted metal-dependent peptidase